ncbi:MAG: cyclic pyranopterin phosphate synthase [Planctomycetota bacterium]|jgi:cyclic pyranopterin phosphate synthase
MTTNGVLLADQAQALQRAGLPRLTVSLDTLNPERYRKLTRRDEHARVVAGIDAALGAGLQNTKLNVVLMRGFNDDELEDFLRFGNERGLEVRFIEYMDVGGATAWNPGTVFPRAEIMARLGLAFGGVSPIKRPANATAPAERFVLGDGTVFGIIASTTAPFCGSCDRSRLTADGTWFQCLYARAGADLRSPLRASASDGELIEKIRGSWRVRADRGAETRTLERERQPLANGNELRNNPHLEMHTRGG